MQSLTRSIKSLTVTTRRSLATQVDSSAAWTPSTQRTGVLARKLGMTALWKQGIRVPVTVLHVSPHLASLSFMPCLDSDPFRFLSARRRPSARIACDRRNQERHGKIFSCTWMHTEETQEHKSSLARPVSQSRRRPKVAACRVHSH